MKIPMGTAIIFAAAVAASVSIPSAEATAVFTDTFGSGSTINATSPFPAPTATSTSYEIASTKNDTTPTSTIASGDLSIKQVATTSGVTEAQALFTSTPVTLSNAGDSIDMRVTFTPTTLGIAGDSDTLYFGLYNSGSPSSAPLSNLQNAGLSTATTSPTGGVAGWQGYVSQISPASTTSTAKIITRPVQTGTTNANQDLVANGASGGTFASPNGTTLPSNFINPSASGLTAGTAYTEDLLITLNADGSETLAENLYQGTDTTGTNIVTQNVSTSPTLTVPVATSFDALAIGFRYSGTKAAATMDVSSLIVSSNVAGPVLLLGDANGDGHVDLTDLNTVLNHLGTTDSARADGNFDGAATIDLTDLNDVLNNLGVSAPAAAVPTTPEPASLSLLAAGALLLTRRRLNRN